MIDWTGLILAAGTTENPRPLSTGEEPLLHPGETVLLALGIFLTIAMTVFFIFILRMAHRDSAAEDDASDS